jgi:hypothetical protein
MDTDIEEILAEPGSNGTNVHIRALVSFSAQTARDFAQVFSSTTFPATDPISATGVRWEATIVSVTNAHGSYRLFICGDRDLAM